MKTSLRWLQSYLSKQIALGPVQQALIDRGFPVESVEQVGTIAGADTCLDVEITSNRGDCMSHLGLAREIAATRELLCELRMPLVAELSGAVPATDPTPVSSVVSLENTVHSECPLFLVRVIRGVKVGPSPAWLSALLEGAGQRPINNVVDATNFIALELGNPCHAFDLAKLAGAKIVVRAAREGEKLTTLDGKHRTLRVDEIVVADGERAQSLAGVMGGALSEVSASTTDVVLEMATWNPIAVRRASRRHQLRTTASARYERLVDARSLDDAADRCAALIAAVSGGRVMRGTLRAGASVPPLTTIRLRPARCAAILGSLVPTPRLAEHLAKLGIETAPLGRSGEELLCTVPAHRPDLTREIDLIEEVARIEGLGAIPTHGTLAVSVKSAQPEQRVLDAVGATLAGLGFYETVTFSFTTRAAGQLFLPEGLALAEVFDDRRGDEPTLRPSVLCGLLACRKHNQHAGVKREGGIRLFEIASVFAQTPEQQRGIVRGAVGTISAGDRAQVPSMERTTIALLLDAPGKGKGATTAEVQAGLRLVRGAIDQIVAAVAGAGSLREGDLHVEPAAPHARAFRPAAYARLAFRGEELGHFGVLDRTAQEMFDLAMPVVGAELSLEVLCRAFPPKANVFVPPAFPGIERDVSLLVDESVRWGQIAEVIGPLRVDPLEGFSFVSVFRGGPIPAGKKSVTVRLAYRDAARTLTHQEVDGPVAWLLAGLKEKIRFEVRA